MSIFSQRLKELRIDKQLSMFQLANEIEVSDAAICKWENDLTEPRATSILAIANFFEVSTDYLLGLECDIGIKKYSTPKRITYNLSTEEQELLDNFKSLPRQKRAQALEYINYLAEKRGNKNKHA